MGKRGKGGKGDKGGKITGHGRTGGGNVKPSMRKKSKLVVTFDADKRKEYLTGFHKRKQERRRFGLDMEAYKQKKQLMEAKKQRRAEQKERLAALNIDEKTLLSDDESANDEDDDGSDEGEGGPVTQVLTFDDAHTQDKFGDVVTVTTSVGDLPSESEDELSDDADDEEDDEEEEHARPAFDRGRPKEKQLTLFQRIQLKRRGKALPSKRAKLKQARASRKAMLVKKGMKMASARNAAASKDEDGDSKPRSGGKHKGGARKHKKH